jgi:predicted nuclease of restriction endonuclease-like RecB superfamily
VLAAAFGEVARAHIGSTREQLDDALENCATASDAPGAERRLVAAVRKLVADGCAFEEPDAEAAATLRREIFRRAAAERRAASPSRPFDRGALLDAAARERGMTADAVEAGLYGDRPARQRLLSFAGRPPAALAAGFELAEAQAVLLRATRVEAKVRARDAGTYRALFRTLKFQRLFAAITATGDGGYTIALDGPLSLFQGSTRYGLQLGLALPAIAACDVWSIDADVRWGADRRPLRFRIGGGRSPRTPPPRRRSPTSIAAFVGAFEKLDSGWRIDRRRRCWICRARRLRPRSRVRPRPRRRAVHFELLGFWSREAVWRRVELVRAGLPHRILFAVSKNLRVGEPSSTTHPTAGALRLPARHRREQVLDRIERNRRGLGARMRRR